LKRTLGNKYEHLSTCGVFWWQSFAICVNFLVRKKFNAKCVLSVKVYCFHKEEKIQQNIGMNISKQKTIFEKKFEKKFTKT